MMITTKSTPTFTVSVLAGLLFFTLLSSFSVRTKLGFAFFFTLLSLIISIIYQIFALNSSLKNIHIFAVSSLRELFTRVNTVFEK